MNDSISKKKPMLTRSIRFDEKDLLIARILDINISKIARESLKKAIEISEEVKKKKPA